jgi:XTP/dITP diphosphohydrolase
MTPPDTIHFVTGNAGKFNSAKRYADMAGLNPDLFTHTPLDITEIQADTVEKVALDKARKAYNQLRAPVMVNDGGLHITALDGFPGVYSEYILRTIGCEGILKLMDGLTGEDRAAHFKGAVVYIDGDGQEYTFHGSTHDGKIAHDIRPMQREDAWNSVWRIFIPDPIAGNRTLSELSDEQMKKYLNESLKISALYEAIVAIADDDLRHQAA